MAKKQNYWYVLVITIEGCKFVTSTERTNYAHWNELEPPKEFSRDTAKDIALGLNLNGTVAYAVCSPWEIENQPYNYKDYKFEIVERGEESGYVRH